MIKLLHKLLSICLAVALSTVPLPAFASEVMAGGCEHGGMHATSSQVEQQKPACKHCQSKHCEDGSCSQPDCSACFSNLISVPVFTFGFSAPHELPVRMTPAGLLSRGDPPLLRPPL